MPPRIVLVTPPGIEPLTLQEAKDYARIDTAADDTMVSDLIAAARKRCEPRQGRAYLTQTWDLFLDDFPRDDAGCDLPIVVPRPPLQSITSITYTPYNGAPIPLVAGTDYFVDTASFPGRALRSITKAWPRTTLQPANAVAVRFVAGYGATAANVPEQTRLALKQLVAFWYRNRDAMEQIPPAIDALLTEATGGFVYA